MKKPSEKNQRTRGVKPQDTTTRAEAVAQAVRTLERIGAPFTVAEVAEKAGLSRATLYRNADLRALVGAKGDCVRPIDPEVHTKLADRHSTLKAKAREMRRQIADSEEAWDRMRERALRAEHQLQSAQEEIARLRELVQNSASQSHALSAIAQQIGPDAVRKARRQLARALHPDLFAKDPTVVALATELLKTLNSLAD